MSEIKISVVIPTKNRSKDLDELLNYLKMQTLPADYFEIIVIDNDSTDNTQAIIKKYYKNFPNFSSYIELKEGSTNARHLGVKKAESELLAFCDDDIIPFISWLEEILTTFNENPNIALITGNNFPLYKSSPPPWLDYIFAKYPYGKASGAISIFDFGIQPKKIPSGFAWGCNFAIRKDILLKAGGFHVGLMPNKLEYFGDEESYLAYWVEMHNYDIYFTPKASVWHKVYKERMSLEYLAKRCFIQGITDSYTLIRNSLLKTLPIPQSTIKNFDLQELIKNELKDYDPDKVNQDDIQQIISDFNNLGKDFHINKLDSSIDLLSYITKDNYLDDTMHKLSTDDLLKYIKNLLIQNRELQENKERFFELIKNESSNNFLGQLALSNLLYTYSSLAEIKYPRIILFGAGTHTKWLIKNIGLNSLRAPAMILDDNPSCESFNGISVIKPNEFKYKTGDCIVLSTDIWQNKMKIRCNTLFTNVKIIDLYKGLPTGPYNKFSGNNL